MWMLWIIVACGTEEAGARASSARGAPVEGPGVFVPLDLPGWLVSPDGWPTDTAAACDCGSNPYGMPNYECEDGSWAGPTCVDHDDGTCAWEIVECP